MSDDNEIAEVDTPVLPEDIDHADAEKPLKASEGLAADLAKVRREKRAALAENASLKQRLTEMERSGLSDLEKLKAEKEDLARMIDQINAEKTAAQRDKTRVVLAKEFGLPDGWEKRIQGDDEDSMRLDAEELAKLVAPTAGPGSPARKSAQVRNLEIKKNPNDALKAWIASQKNG